MISTAKTREGNAAQVEIANKTEAIVTANHARLISKVEVLDRVGASYPTIWQWMREGKFPRSRQLGGKSMWLEAEVEAWILARPVRRLKGDAA